MKDTNKLIYLVTYNDCYGNGDKNIEGYVEANDYAEAQKNLTKWLKARNKCRIAEGEIEENEEEFDLKQINKL